MNKFIISFAAVAAFAATASAQTASGITISEIRIDQGGSDVDEFFELTAPAGTSLDGISYLVIGDGSTGSGTIENVVDLTGQVIPASGYFVAAEASFTLGIADMTTGLDFENSDNVTHMLVRDFTGVKGDDADTTDDGNLDTIFWTSILDSIAIRETDPAQAGEQLYSDNVVGPNGSFAPAMVYRTSAPGLTALNIGQFSDGSLDTPGAPNPDGSVSAASGGSQFFTVRAGSVNAGGLYLVLTNGSGTSPGTPVDGVVLPLNIDSTLLLSLTSANGLVFQGNLGFLDTNGIAHSQMVLPALSPATVGVQANTAALVFDATVTSAQFASGAVSLNILL